MHAVWRDVEGGEDTGGDAEGVEDGGAAVKERFFVFLEVFVVSEGEAFESVHEAGHLE